MAKMKTEFELERSFAMKDKKWRAYANIARSPDAVMVSFTVYNDLAFVVPHKIIAHAGFKKNDLERFAVNILKALGSKKLKQ